MGTARVTGRHPFQQAFFRYHYPPVGTKDRIQTAVGLKGQAGQCKDCLRQLRRDRAKNRGKMLAGQHVCGLTQQIDH